MPKQPLSALHEPTRNQTCLHIDNPSRWLYKERNCWSRAQRLRSRNETVFDKETAFYYSNNFSPKDIVCIADRSETENSLRQSGIWETSGGTTVLLSPLRINPTHTRYGPRKSNVFYRLAVTTARSRILFSECPSGMKDWPNFSHGERFAFQSTDTLHTK